MGQSPLSAIKHNTELTTEQLPNVGSLFVICSVHILYMYVHGSLQAELGSRKVKEELNISETGLKEELAWGWESRPKPANIDHSSL